MTQLLTYRRSKLGPLWMFLWKKLSTYYSAWFPNLFDNIRKWFAEESYKFSEEYTSFLQNQSFQSPRLVFM